MKKIIGSESRFLTGIALLFVILSISASCTKSTDYNNGSGTYAGNGTGAKGGPGANEVWIQGMAFNPSTISVTAGTTITWTNKDAIGHTVTSDTGLFDSGMISTNGTFTSTFSTAGTFSYICSVHPMMTGTVVVK
jgi:plastocyanin